MTDSVKIFGVGYSVYVRIARLALEEKGVPYELDEVDIFASGGLTSAYLQRHPFGRIPAFEHNGFRLYETGAIGRYVDEAFDGPPLHPQKPQGRARMSQIISILDNYAYRTLIWDIFVERVRAPAEHRTPDEVRISSALPKAKVCLETLEDIVGDSQWLTGQRLTLADLHAAPMFAYFMLTPESGELMAPCPHLQEWWKAVSTRESMAATRSPLE